MTTLTINLAQSTSDLISACRHCRGGKNRKTKHHNSKCSKLDSFFLTSLLKTNKSPKLQFLGTMNGFLIEESACLSFTGIIKKITGLKERRLPKPWIVYDPMLEQ